MNQKLWMFYNVVDEDNKVYKSIITPVIRFSQDGMQVLCVGYHSSVLSYSVLDKHFVLQESLPNLISNHIYTLKKCFLANNKEYIAEILIAGVSLRHETILMLTTKENEIVENNRCVSFIQDICEVLKL